MSAAALLVRRRVVAALAGAGLVVTAVPALAASPRTADEDAALELLVDAASAGRTLSYAGTQYVATWGPSASSTTLVELEHAPGRGATVRHTGEGDAPEPVLLSSAPMNQTLVEVLRDRYQLRVVGEGTCTGRAAQVVEATRPGATGSASVAGRFWVDRETGLLLRREVFDADGRRLRSSAFLDLAVTAPQAAAAPAARAASRATGDAVSASGLRRLRDAGWHVPDDLPRGFTRFDTRLRDHGGAQVLHAAYSDGLSTTSLFSQPGELGSTGPEGFAPVSVEGSPVWVSRDVPQRVVWAGGGRVWTLVSDAPVDAVREAVTVLPHDAAPAVESGWRARLSRGASRMAAALNPFS